jgi:hypothetical protein
MTTVKIDTKALGIPWAPNTGYRIQLDADFTEDPNGNPSPLVTNALSFTTNSTGPSFSSSNPANGATGVSDLNISLTFNRKIQAGSGTIRLYRSGGTLVHSFSVTDSAVTFSNGVCTVYLGTYLADNLSYYILIDAGTFKDYDGFSSIAVSSNNTISFSTGPNYILGAAPASEYYNEDTSELIAPYIQIVDAAYTDTTGYSLTVTPSSTNAVITLVATGAATKSFNNSTKVLTLSGTRAAINDSLQKITITPGGDYRLNFTLSYVVTTPRSTTSPTKVQNFIFGSPDQDVTPNITTSRSYASRKSVTLFPDNIPQITDNDPTGAQFTIRLSSNAGALFSINYSNPTNNWTYTGTKAQINAAMGTILYHSVPGNQNGDTITYTQTKSTDTADSHTVIFNFSMVLTNITVNQTNSGSGTVSLGVATMTLDNTSLLPFNSGQTVTVSGSSDSFINGGKTLTTASSTTVTFPVDLSSIAIPTTGGSYRQINKLTFNNLADSQNGNVGAFSSSVGDTVRVQLYDENYPRNLIYDFTTTVTDYTIVQYSGSKATIQVLVDSGATPSISSTGYHSGKITNSGGGYSYFGSMGSYGTVGTQTTYLSSSTTLSLGYTTGSPIVNSTYGLNFQGTIKRGTFVGYTKTNIGESMIFTFSQYPGTYTGTTIVPDPYAFSCNLSATKLGDYSHIYGSQTIQIFGQVPDTVYRNLDGSIANTINNSHMWYVAGNHGTIFDQNTSVVLSDGTNNLTTTITNRAESTITFADLPSFTPTTVTGLGWNFRMYWLGGVTTGSGNLTVTYDQARYGSFYYWMVGGGGCGNNTACGGGGEVLYGSTTTSSTTIPYTIGYGGQRPTPFTSDGVDGADTTIFGYTARGGKAARASVGGASGNGNAGSGTWGGGSSSAGFSTYPYSGYGYRSPSNWRLQVEWTPYITSTGYHGVPITSDGSVYSSGKPGTVPTIIGGGAGKGGVPWISGSPIGFSTGNLANMDWYSLNNSPLQDNNNLYFDYPFRINEIAFCFGGGGSNTASNSSFGANGLIVVMALPYGVNLNALDHEHNSSTSSRS